MEEMEFDFDTDFSEGDEDKDVFTSWDTWVYDIFDDMDLVTFLYSDLFTLTPDDTYHFDNWLKQQFFVPEHENEIGLEEDIHSIYENLSET